MCLPDGVSETAVVSLVSCPLHACRREVDSESSAAPAILTGVASMSRRPYFFVLSTIALVGGIGADEPNPAARQREPLFDGLGRGAAR